MCVYVRVPVNWRLFILIAWLLSCLLAPVNDDGGIPSVYGNDLNANRLIVFYFLNIKQ